MTDAVLLVPSWTTTTEVRLDWGSRTLSVGETEAPADHGSVLWNRPLHDEPVETVTAKRAMFDAFQVLGAQGARLDGTEESWAAWGELVLAFAQRWGVLGLCGHDLPASHRGDHRIMQMLVAEADGMWLDDPPADAVARADEQRQSFPGMRCEPHRQERLSTWLWFAVQANAILLSADLLRRSEPADDEIVRVRSLSPTYVPWLPEQMAPLMRGGQRWHFPGEQAETDLVTRKLTRREAIRQQRSFLAEVVGEWLSLADVALQVTWDEDSEFKMAYSTTGLFGAIAVDLALKVGNRKGYWICSHCFTPYSDRDREPKAGSLNNYCGSCKQAGPKARYRAKVRENGGRLLRSTDPDEPTQ